MTKRYAILQKKLEELESLAQVFSLHHPQTTACPHLPSDDFHQRFLFLTNLLQAEIASHPSKPHHLAHIAHRLTQLESAFQNWDHHGSDSLPDGLNSVDTCSCTESCLDDDSEEGEEMFFEAVAEEEEDNELVGSAREEEEERGGWGWRYLGAMGGGMVVGAMVMGFAMVRFSGCFDFVEYQTCLVPT